MPSSEEQPTKRGRRARLSRDQIVGAATEILRQGGVDALTIRAVSTSVGSSPMAVYRHVRDKEHLLVLVLDRVASEIRKPSLPREPRARIIALWSAIHACLEENAWAVELLASGDKMPPSVLWFMERVVRAMLESGLSERETARTVDALWRFTVGSLLVQRGRAAHANTGSESSMQQRLFEQPDPAEFPALTTIATRWRGVRAQESFRSNLGLLLDGVHEWD